MKRVACWRGVLFICILLLDNMVKISAQDYPQCSNLQLAQFDCISPQTIDDTDSIVGCMPDGTVQVTCIVVDGVICNGSRTFTQQQPCFYTNGYSFIAALTLSLFLGIFGIDRFYLGYPTIGLFKLFTCGGFIIGNWIDILLIATQTLKPADGSNYVVKINGPRQTHFLVNNQTYYVPQVTPYI